MHSLQSHIFKSLPEKEQEKLITEFCNISRINPNYLDIDYGYKEEEEGEKIEKIYFNLYLNKILQCKIDLKYFNKYNVAKFLQKTKSFDFIIKEVIDLAYFIINTVIKKFTCLLDNLKSHDKRNIYFDKKKHEYDIKYSDNIYGYSFKYILTSNCENFYIYFGQKYHSLFHILLDLDLIEKFEKEWNMK
jgi:hypothetical protein